MILGAASTPSNENIQRTIYVENIEQVSDLHRTSDLREAHSFSRSDALHYALPDRSSFPLRIDRSSVQGRCREEGRRRRRRRRWKLNSCFRCTSATEDEDVPCSRDAPPTYSSIFVDPILSRESRSYTFLMDDQSPIVTRIPPPTYAQTQEISLMTSSVDPFVSLSLNGIDDWPRVPTAAICPRCVTLVMTLVTVRRPIITRLTALTLFFFGCWPCCLIPYCVDSYSNADHYCPMCRTYLGTYTP